MPEKEMITYEVERHIGIVSENANSGWTTELNLISWNGKPAKLGFFAVFPANQHGPQIIQRWERD